MPIARFTLSTANAEQTTVKLEGQPRAVTITDVDYGTNVITLDTPLSWAGGTGVSLPFFGTAPDQGAHELEP